MKAPLVAELVCPACRSTLALHVDQERGDDIESGWLRCNGCAHRYPVRNGIPRLLPPAFGGTDARIAAAFGYEWTHFNIQYDAVTDHFLDWIAPLSPADFAGKRVLDAGCGMGRHSLEAARFGAAQVFALDLSDAIDVAQQYTRGDPRIHLIQGDLCHPPLHGDIDLLYSIGVLNQLPDPRAGMAALARLLRPGGVLFAWVYAAEAGRWVTHVVDPLRARVTSHLPFPLLRLLTWPPAVALAALCKLVYRPAGRWPSVRTRLPAFSYLRQLADFPFALLHCTIFDQLVAPAARYCTRDEFASWFAAAGLDAPEITLRHASGWRGVARARLPPPAVPSR